MSKLKYLLFNNGKIVYFTIFEMDKRFFGHSFNAKNGISIFSCASPELSSDECALLGTSQEYNLDCPSLKFSSEKEAKEYIAKIHEALKDWAENWPGWKSEEDKTANNSEIKVVEL